MGKKIDFDYLYDIIDSALQKAESFTLAIDGGSASGKSTLAGDILSEFGENNVTVFHMDDFYLRPEQRTEERFSEAGGNVDRERFLQEILEPLSKGTREILYRPLECKTFTITEGRVVFPKRIRIIEGAYSHHPDLRDNYNLRVFLDISPELQAHRIKRRNSIEQQQLFFDRWIPFENRYFEAFDIKERSDFYIDIRK